MIQRFVCAVLALASLCFAQTPLSLQEAVQKAESQRPELRSATQRVDAATQLRRQSGLIPNPRLFLQSENIRSSNSFDYSRDADTFGYFSQVLETSGRRKGRIAVASQHVERSRLEAELTRREIGFKVRMAYWNAVAAQSTRDLYEQSEQYFKQVVDYHEARLGEGKLAEVDFLRIRLQSEQIHAAADSARLRLERAQLELAREMGVLRPGPWLLTEKFDELESPRSLPESTEAEGSRIEGLLAKQEVAAARARLGLEKAKGRPDVDALFGYKRTAGLNTAMAGLQFNLPLFDRNQGAAAAARFEVGATENTFEATRIQLNLEASIARRDYESRLQQVKSVFGPLRERAMQIADISRAAYREGGLDLLRLLDAERLRVDSQLSWVDALTQYHRSVVELERAEGVQP